MSLYLEKNERPPFLTSFMMVLYLFLSIYEGYISPILGSVSRFFLILFFFYFLIFYGVKKVSVMQGLMLAFLVYYCISIAWTPNIEQAFLYMPTVVIMLLLLIIFSNIHFPLSYVNRLLSVYKYISFSVGILGLFFSKPYKEVLSRSVLTLFGVQIDPNNLVALYGIGVGLSLYSLVIEGKAKFLNLCISVVNIYCIFSTGSRSGIVLVAVLLLLLLFIKRERISFFNQIVMLFFLFLGCIGLISFLPETTVERLLGSDELSFTDGTGREDYWSVGLSLFLQHPISGNGWGAFSCHNTFLTMLVDIGLLGFITFLSFLYLLFRRTVNYKTVLPMMLLMIGLLPSFFIDAQNKRLFWNAFLIPILIVNSYIYVESNE